MKPLPEVGTPEWDALRDAIHAGLELARQDMDDYYEASRVKPEQMNQVIGPGRRGWPHQRT